MKAIYLSKYGRPEVLTVREMSKPEPRIDEVLIRVKAASITAADSIMRSGTPWIARLAVGLFKPKNPITGTGFSGVVEQLGEDVSSFKIGDKVFGETTLGFGAQAEYVCVKADGLVLHMPENISFEDTASLCDGALTSYNFIHRQAKLKKQQSILILGAAGSLGTAAVQIAHKIGAHVTAVCSSSNTALVQSLGADEFIDYNKNDFTKSNQQYDVVFDTIGKYSMRQCCHILIDDGLFMSPVISFGLFFEMMVSKLFGAKKAMFCATGLLKPEVLKPMLNEIRHSISVGTFNPVVTRQYSMDQIVDAHRYIETGHKQGNIVLQMV